jgi:hypothetical protein
MLEFLERMEKTPKILLLIFFILTIVFIVINGLLMTKKDNCPTYHPCPSYNCPNCNCAPCQICKKCKKCKDEKSPCKVDVMVDCVFDPENYYDDCVKKLPLPVSNDNLKKCKWESSLYTTELDKESCKTKCLDVCPTDNPQYDCPTYCENECCNYDYHCR